MRLTASLLLALLLSSPVYAGTLYIDSGGASTNSGSTDQNTANLTGTNLSISAGAVLQLDASTDLSSVVTSGATQSSIFITNATNANTLIFWITAVDDGLDQVTVSVAPTLSASPSNWSIGGRSTSMTNVCNVLRAGDQGTVNTNVSAAGLSCTFRNSGDNASGYVKLVGKTGSRPSITSTNTTAAISYNSLSGIYTENLEIAQQGASGNAITAAASNKMIFKNIKVSDCGGATFSGVLVNGSILQGSEFSGIGGNAVTLSGAIAYGNHIHDVTGSGIDVAGTGSQMVMFNTVERCVGRGLLFSGGPATINQTSLVLHNTVYRCDQSGIEIVDVDLGMVLINNILKDNGDAGTEANINHTTGNFATLGFSLNNTTSIAGARGGVNFLNASLDSSSIITDPQFIDPDNGTAANRNFGILGSSPARMTGTPGTFLGSLSVGYNDMGAVQRKDSAVTLYDVTLYDSTIN